jgi:hypothetical protein
MISSAFFCRRVLGLLHQRFDLGIGLSLALFQRGAALGFCVGNQLLGGSSGLLEGLLGSGFGIRNFFHGIQRHGITALK